MVIWTPSSLLLRPRKAWPWMTVKGCLTLISAFRRQYDQLWVSKIIVQKLKRITKITNYRRKCSAKITFTVSGDIKFTGRDCNPGIPNPGIPGSRMFFLIPNPGFVGVPIPGYRDWKKYLLNCLLNNKFRHKRTYIIIKRRSDVVY